MYPIPSTNNNLLQASIFGQTFGDDSHESLPVMHIKIHTPTKVATHPVESGAVIMDNKVLEPVEIEATCILYVSEYDTWIKKLYNALDTKSDQTYSVQTKTDLYENMILEDMVEDQAKDKYDVVTIILRFRQMLKADVTKEKARGNAAPAPSSQQDTKNVNSGEAPQKPVVNTVPVDVQGKIFIPFA